MPNLVQLTYSSVASRRFRPSELRELLALSRQHNHELGVTGILLYADGSFFQVLEGATETVEKLFDVIARDKRHRQVTEIIKEPIAQRDFGEWTMGYTELTDEEANAILGANDFFINGNTFTQLQHNRARKLLQAFKEGRWRSRLSGGSSATVDVIDQAGNGPADAHVPEVTHPMPIRDHYSFAYQPIVDVSSRTIFSYEALIRGINNEPARDVLKKIPAADMHHFDELSRKQAIRIAAHLGLHTHLNLNFLPRSIENSPTAITSLLEVTEHLGIRPEQIVVEILEREIISDYTLFNDIINECRSAGVVFAIDDFGSGYAGLKMLAEFQPNLIKIDMDLIRDIHHRGPRQAILRGILRTCHDLGIDIIAEGVETTEEYQWLYNEGITLYQGNLFARPSFEKLAQKFSMPLKQAVTDGIIH